MNTKTTAPSSPPPHPIPYAHLDPHIRETVRWLAALGFRPTDSGDGRSKTIGRVFDYPHVFMTCAPGELIAEADRLAREFAAAGAVLVPPEKKRMPKGAIRGHIEAHYEPRDGETGVLALCGVDDEALRAAGVFDAPAPDPPATHWLADEPALHIYDHPHPHDDQLIAGTARGLRALRDAVNRALAAPDGHAHAVAMASDGESYCVLVARVDGDGFDKLGPGYTHEMYRDREDPGRWKLWREAELAAEAPAAAPEPPATAPEPPPAAPPKTP